MPTHSEEHGQDTKRHTNPRQINGLLLPAILLALACILLVNGFYIQNRLSTANNGPPSHVLTSHDTATTPSLTASIGNVTENSKFDPAFTLADGETMLIMTLSITNRTKVTQDFIPTSNLYIRTPVGDYRPLHPSMYVTKQIGSGKIAPGQTKTGQISFGVPDKASDLKLYIDTGWNDEVPVVFYALR
jgi:hypothetical protein